MPSRMSAVVALCALSCLDIGRATAASEAWLPVSPEEMQMTSEPQAPGAPAIYLYRQVDRSDFRYFERRYERIKILTEAGLSYANVEIVFAPGAESIRDISARTIQPDGSTVEFDGTVYEKPIIRDRNAKVMAKVFTLPAAKVGSIVEYRYTHEMPYGWVYDSHWILNEELFTRHAKFSLVRNPNLELLLSWPRGVPPGTDNPKEDHGVIRLETHDVPAFVSEELMPPANELRYRVDFIYDNRTNLDHRDPDKYWKGRGKQMFESVHRFIDESHAMQQAVAQIIQAGDSPEARLRKIYARVQQIRNVNYEGQSEREAHQDKPEEIRSVADVWKRGYGNEVQINWLLLALARAGGITADPVLVPTRNTTFFDRRLMNSGQLRFNAVQARLDGRELFLNAGVPFTPFGLLPWYETFEQALRLDSDGGTWVEIPSIPAADSRIERKAQLKFDSGTLQGKLTVTYRGLEASWRRLRERAEDDTARRQYLESEVERAVPSGIHVTLTNAPDWTGAETPLVAEYDLEVPGWASPAGRRVLIALGLFGGGERRMLERDERIHPVYFDFPYRHLDDIAIELPPEWHLESTPQPRLLDLKGAVYKSSAQHDANLLHVTRELTVDLTIVPVKSYDSLHKFFETVRTGDEDQAVVSYTGSPARK